MTATGRKVLITGATGMLGANLVRTIAGDGARAAVLVRSGSNRIRLLGMEAGLDIFEGDLTAAESVKAAFRAALPDVVFHLASTPFNPPLEPAVHYRTNVLGTLNLLEAAAEVGTSRLVFTSSGAEYGAGANQPEDSPLEPATILGASKAAATILIRAYARQGRVGGVVLRLFTPYGPWESPRRLIPQTILSALEGRNVDMSRGDQQRDYLYVDDIVNALLLAANPTVKAGSVYNIGSGAGIPVKEVVQTALALLGNPVRCNLGALPSRPDEIMVMSADASAASRDLGWKPRTSLREGLLRTIEWIKEHRQLVRELP